MINTKGKAGLIAVITASTLFLGGCATQTGNKTATGAAVGAGTGALLGNVVAGSGNRTGGTLIGAAVGATVGGLVGRQMDLQEEQLRREMAGTHIDVQRLGDTIRLKAPDSITFDTNSAEIKPEFRAALDQIARSINQYDGTVVRVEGHTDSTGRAEYNQTLSVNRAQSVVSYLAQRGVAHHRMQAIGYGQSQPIASNDTPEGRAQNRRVEILILPPQQ